MQNVSLFFQKMDLTFHANCLNFMNSKIPFSGKNRSTISICRLLKYLPSMLSVNIGMTRNGHMASFPYNNISIHYLSGMLPVSGCKYP